ncbi:sulfatase [Anaerocolumna cellulosilytica]|uniref:Sulfatase n=1 Tax=Anaerocolumna cellulosilytica TaxID=433286 RepID=A0A6S6QYJ6_9FIRM|nr:sulfatase [Anaerocolumna cellulosilytica]MBB5196264.1 arylsulfatase A-like enzyme [Anaerocolumna cellulosilytica]BCJ96293.1 sulfatase [Anaerocolumna cellulosilytica]
MRAIMIMYDSLRRDILSCYGETAIRMPNFERLAKHTVTFDNSYVCSLPCMPARRELHTGRPNFLHRSWGPIEPFDDSMPEILKKAGIHTHLTTDHYHYLQDGGATYHNRYSTWECFRGQETDTWVGNCAERPTEYSPQLLNHHVQSEPLKTMRKKGGWQNMDNRMLHRGEENYPQSHTFDNGIDFITRNVSYDNWFVQIETFDPHEPFDSPDNYLSHWFDPDNTFEKDWPPYAQVTEDAKTIENMRKKYYSLVEFCDKSLGRVLYIMDKYNMWKDTMLIVNTDHGFSLAEHNWWGKSTMPEYNEIAHTPFFLWDPRSRVSGVHRKALVQTIDIAPTLLDFFQIPIPKDMLGKSLKYAVEADEEVREFGMFGIHGGPINITDGRYVYMRAVRTPDTKVDEYTLMPTHMTMPFSVTEMQGAELTEGFTFTKGCKVLRIPVTPRGADKIDKDLLFDLEMDSKQENPVELPEIERRMTKALTLLLKDNEAPSAVYKRFGLLQP